MSDPNWPLFTSRNAPQRVWHMETDRTMSIPWNVRIGGTLQVVGGMVGAQAAQAQAEAYSAEDVAQLLGELHELRERVDQLEAAITGPPPEDNGRKRRR